MDGRIGGWADRQMSLGGTTKVFIEYMSLELILENWKARCWSGEGGGRPPGEAASQGKPQGCSSVWALWGPSGHSLGLKCWRQAKDESGEAGAMEPGFVMQVRKEPLAGLEKVHNKDYN